MVPKPPQSARPTSTPASSSFERGTSNLAPWYTAGQPKHRVPLIEQRDNPFGKFHLAQGSPLLHLGMHSLSSSSNNSSTAREKTSSSSILAGPGRREVKWTLT
jgi:hypothetical protein